MKYKNLLLLILLLNINGYSQISKSSNFEEVLHISYSEASEEFIIVDGNNTDILRHIVKSNERPYIHPLFAPDGKGILTELRPAHHLHQTGIFWGLKEVNGRDFFMNWDDNYWKKESSSIISDAGKKIVWQTVYNMLDEFGGQIMTETQNWSLKKVNNKYILDLEWVGEAKMNIAINKFYVGGLFIRMPWKKGTPSEIINSAGQHNMDAEAQRAIWTDLGVLVEGRDDFAHIAVFDHPDNMLFPTPWRIDSQMGMGPSVQILDGWNLIENESKTFKFRLFIYLGEFDRDKLNDAWKEYILH